MTFIGLGAMSFGVVAGGQAMHAASHAEMTAIEDGFEDGAWEDDWQVEKQQSEAEVVQDPGDPDEGNVQQVSKVLGPDDETGANFGDVMDFDGQRVLVGAPGANRTAGSGPYKGDPLGMGYLFTWGADGQLVQTATLQPADPEEVRAFGQAVALDGDTALVTASTKSETNPATYVFVRSDDGWVQQARIAADDINGSFVFGENLALDEDFAMIGDQGNDNDAGDGAGAVYVFSRDGTTWTQDAKLIGNDTEGVRDYQAGDGFGRSVALDADTALIGAPSDDNEGGDRAGAAYVFTRGTDGWQQQAKLTADDGEESDTFGTSVDLHSGLALIGAPWANNETGVDTGGAYVFSRQADGWSQEAKLTAEDGELSDQFGGSVAVGDGTAVVGADAHDDKHEGYSPYSFADEAGAVYWFRQREDGWSQQAELLTDEPQSQDRFGRTVALEDDLALIGAPGEDGPEGESGAVYAFYNGTGNPFPDEPQDASSMEDNSSASSTPDPENDLDRGFTNGSEKSGPETQDQPFPRSVLLIVAGLAAALLRARRDR